MGRKNSLAKTPQTRIMGLTDYLISLPSPWKTFLLIVVFAALVGMLGAVLQDFRHLYNGMLFGLFLLGAPALLGAFAMSGLTMLRPQRLLFKRSIYLCFFTMVILSVLYLMALLIPVNGAATLFDSLIYGYVLIFMIEVFVLSVTSPYKMHQNIIVAAPHAAIGFVFLAGHSVLGSTAASLPARVSVAPLLAKIAFASLMLLVGVALFIVLINAPMRRNFKVKTFSLAKVFITHWYHGSMEIEKMLKGMGEKASTLIGVIVFKSKRGTKAVLVVPYLHPGPFGSVGGGRLTEVLTQNIEASTGASVLIPHGTVTHDLDPITSKSLLDISQLVSESIGGIALTPRATRAVRAQSGGAQFIAQQFGNSLFLASSFAPKITEDIDFAIGIAVMNRLQTSDNTVIYADAHNCYERGKHGVFSGDPTMFALFDALPKLDERLSMQKPTALKLGLAKDALAEYSSADGAGPTGVRVAVFEAGGQRTAYILFDANNLAQGLREKIILALKKGGMDEAEVMTTDSHCVNSVRGVENPLGERIDQQPLVRKVLRLAYQAVQDLEPVSAGGKMLKIDNIDVLGPQKTIQLVATVNSMIAIMKILSPIIFMSAMILSLLGVMLIPW